MNPIIGCRYKCTQCEDYDLCEKCEQKGVHSHHTFLKIRKPHHAPAQFTCKYREDMGRVPLPNLHIEKAIDMNEMAKTF